VIVVDTSVLVDFFRGSRTVASERLRQIEMDQIPFAIPGVCCQELLAGARDEKEWRLLYSYLETQDILWPIDPWATYSEAARIMFDCRARGLSVRGSIDCLIAQLTLDHDGTLLHSDKDFDSIALVRPLRMPA
jgi:predicted nucleic acid-binding protein